MNRRNEERFQHESLQDLEALTAYLRKLADGFQSGQLEFGGGEHRLLLEPKGLIRMDVKAKKNRNRVGITFKLSWGEESESSGENRDTEMQGDDSQV